MNQFKRHFSTIGWGIFDFDFKPEVGSEVDDDIPERVIHWINIPITLLSARNSQMEILWRPKYLDSQPCITPNKPEPPKLQLESQNKSKKGKRRTKIEREIMISVSHLIRKKLKTEDIILENSTESLDLGSHRSYLYV